MLGISNAIMGLTVIAWGNSVGDAVSNVIVSRKGHPQMAMSACIAAPLTSKTLFSLSPFLSLLDKFYSFYCI
jgi:sodium/potassium/calcium exchanger 6